MLKNDFNLLTKIDNFGCTKFIAVFLTLLKALQ